MRFKFKHASALRTTTQNVIVKLTDANGEYGYGEGCPREYVTAETAQSVSDFMCTYGSTIVNEIDSLESLRSWIDANESLIDNNPSAFCAIEIALLDLLARRQQLPVESLLGLSRLPDSINFTAIIGSSSPHKTRLITAAYRLYGFKDYKVKISGDLALDQNRLRMIPSNAAVRVDANNLWSQADSCIGYCQQIQRSIWAIEEPVKAFDYPAMSEITDRLDTKIILDESLYTNDHVSFVKDNSKKFIANIRVSKCGGIIRAINLASHCQRLGVDVILGAHVGETSLLTRAALCVGQGCDQAPVAREGAYGKILLKRDIAKTDVRFGRGGVLRPENYGFAARAGLGLEVTASQIGWSN